MFVQIHGPDNVFSTSWSYTISKAGIFTFILKVLFSPALYNHQF